MTTYNDFKRGLGPLGRLILWWEEWKIRVVEWWLSLTGGRS